MNKKGFTLIEVLGVIVILSVVILIAVPAVINVSKSIKENMYCTKIGQIEQAATLYAEENQLVLDENCDVNGSTAPCMWTTIGVIASSDYISKDKKVNYVTDPRDNSNIETTSIVIYQKNSRYTSTIAGVCGSDNVRYALNITIFPNGGILNEASPIAGAEGEEITINNPIKENYEFLGWRRSDNNELITSISFIMPDSDLTLTAQWEFTGYILTILTDGGIWDGITPQTHNVGDHVTINMPIKANRVFIGWRRSDNNELITESSFRMPTNHLTLTAEWFQYLVDYIYKNESQTFTAPYSGYYKLEVWGAEGGESKNLVNSEKNMPGGKGGYSIGAYYMSAGDIIYVYTGGQGKISGCTASTVASYNGGGSSGYWTGYSNPSHVCAAGGGGATHISTTNNLLKDLYSDINSILIVAGGGGGAAQYYSGSTIYYSGVGGSGGGLTGTISTHIGTETNNTSGGAGIQSGFGTSYAGTTAGFGYGGSNSSAGDHSCGGGGGLYGGGVGYRAGCGGGSGYIGGVISHGEVTATTLDGTTPSGNKGNGRATITYLGES